jgi:hypothetical protein
MARGDPAITRLDAQEHVRGLPDQSVIEQYIGPADEGETDPFRDYDMWVARRAMAVLKTHYPGHLWQVQSDTKAHLLKISIPILMGVCHWYVINLKTHEMTPQTVMRGGGEILERYGLSRGSFELGSFLSARQEHSKLLKKRRPVPGGIKKRRMAGA